MQDKLRATIQTTLKQIPWNRPTIPIDYQTTKPNGRRGRPKKINMESSNDSRQIKKISHEHVTITSNAQKNSEYNLRSGHKTNHSRISSTNNDVTTKTKDTQRTNTKAQLPIYTATTQQLTSNKQQNFTKQTDSSNNNSNSP